MRSLNLGEQEGKPDYGLIFDDFPNCWIKTNHFYYLIRNDYEALFIHALGKITLEDLQKAREYGCKKYARENWSASRGTSDHDNFLAKNKRSLYRHLVALKHEDIDKDSGCLHWAMVALRCMIAIEYGKESRQVLGYKEFLKDPAREIDQLVTWIGGDFKFWYFEENGYICYGYFAPKFSERSTLHSCGHYMTGTRAPENLRKYWKESVRKRT
jgi:hypothetical protein